MVISYLLICFSSRPNVQTQALAKTPVSRWTKRKHEAPPGARFEMQRDDLSG